MDISVETLTMARKNASAHGLPSLAFVLGDLTQPLFRPESLDLVLSNPPYISEEDYAALSPEVRGYEPRGALMPGPLGLEHAEALAAVAGPALREGGLLLMEMGWDQGDAVRGIFSARGWRELRVIKDMEGRDRLLAAGRP